MTYFRPKTRGELRDRLAKGESCETRTFGAEATTLLLQGWLQFEAFTTRPSENEGWTVFEPVEGKPTSPVPDRTPWRSI